jgi:hypothetical protein
MRFLGRKPQKIIWGDIFTANESGMDKTVLRMRVSVRESCITMAREAHLEAARHHLEAASKHLEAVSKYNEGDVYGAERRSEEAWMASQIADEKSVEAHRQATQALKMKLV